MQEGVCPDCHATVGGHSHRCGNPQSHFVFLRHSCSVVTGRLRGDNAHAAIDGSSGPAWPQ
jgi:hypothetical protein